MSAKKPIPAPDAELTEAEIKLAQREGDVGRLERRVEQLETQLRYETGKYKSLQQTLNERDHELFNLQNENERLTEAVARMDRMIQQLNGVVKAISAYRFDISALIVRSDITPDDETPF